MTYHAIETLTKVLKGLRVYPDNMLREIYNSRGCYAAARVKDYLKEHLGSLGLKEEDIYRLVQLAAFNVFEPSDWEQDLRDQPPQTLRDADTAIDEFQLNQLLDIESIQTLIPQGRLRQDPQLAATVDDVQKWNGALRKLFVDDGSDVCVNWDNLFKPSHVLTNEVVLFNKILGI